MDLRSFESTTTDDGRFLFARVPPGSFTISCLDCPNTRYIGTVDARAGETNQVVLANAQAAGPK
jgi:hypothetical protein